MGNAHIARVGMWFLLSTVQLLSCAGMTGTPMPGGESCRYVPTIDDCYRVAERIQGSCLRDCVIGLCRDGVVICTESTQGQCSMRSSQHGNNDQVGGWVLPRGQTCLSPVKEINWCEIDFTPECQAEAMVHELSHACGWHHGDGFGVPGNDGAYQCR